jgi:transposase InsO family protein
VSARIPRGAIGDAILGAKIRDLFDAHPGAGARKLRGLLALAGVRTGRARLIRLMKRRDMSGSRYPFKIRSAIEYAPRLVPRGMIPADFDRVWCGDVTPIKTADGIDLQVAVWLDLRSRRLIGWGVSDSPDTDLTGGALDEAVKVRRPAPGLIVHSDRGSHYSGIGFRLRLADRGFVQSMSRQGNCHDNAAVEAFFAIFKLAIDVRALRFKSFAEARLIVVRFLAGQYNTHPHESLGYHSPESFERLDRETQDRILRESRARLDKLQTDRAARRKRERERERSTLLTD